MKVLIVGGGGREHALAWKISQSPRVKKIFCAPGNAGISEYAECVNIKPENIEGLVNFALDKNIDLTVVGPELPLTLGIVDEFEQKGLKIIGPSKKAAEIEGSKSFAKNLMKKYGIPTAEYKVFKEAKGAKAYIEEIGVPCVVKADGLAAGKGVIICFTKDEAYAAIDNILIKNKFKEAGNRIVIEEYLEGQEVSILAFTDGKTIIPMVSAQDHKRVFDGDKGPNTGGMGAYSPALIYTPDIQEEVKKEILEKTVNALREEGRLYKGILYAGLMLTKKGPKVLEFNARFGDPETQVILPRLKTDLVEIFEGIVGGNLNKINIEWFDDSAVCVVVAAGGYPEEYKRGMEIKGLKDLPEHINVFHAGTKVQNGKVVTNGGRVIGVVALGENLQEAIANVYQGVNKLYFEDMHYRRDIGKKGLL